MNKEEIKPTWNYILNDIALSSLIIRNLYSESASIQDKKDLECQIELIQQENKQLKERIDKAIEYIENKDISVYQRELETTRYVDYTVKHILLKILKGSD